MDKTAMTASELVGCEVQVIFHGDDVAWTGKAEYVTPDGWVGIRDAQNPGPFGPRLDEVELANVWAVGAGGARYQTW